MFFKLEYLLSELTIKFNENEPLRLSIGQNTSVTIRPFSAEEKQKYDKTYLIGTAITEQEPSSEVRIVFDRLANNLMPDGLKKPKGARDSFKYIDEQGRILENWVPDLSLFSEDFQDFASQVNQHLSNSIKESVRIVRWRSGMFSSHNPVIGTMGLSWSFDTRGDWRPMPHTTSVDVSLIAFWKPSPSVHAQIESLLDAKTIEPLGHELLREAWELQSNNPRSALAIGMSAAEVGFKQCIGKLVPAAEWLANNAPTPPLDKMLSTYLPILPARLKIEGRVLKPPKRIRSAIGKGIVARNTSVHAGSEPPKLSELKELLLSIRDLLYLLDFYCGFDWALDHIRDEVRQEMVTEFDLKSR